MIIQGELVPNYAQMGTESMPQGNGAALPLGLADPTSQAGYVSTASMQQSGTDSATSNIGYRPESGPQRYRPEAGRADRLGANIVGMTFDNLASGGYSGGATHRI